MLPFQSWPNFLQGRCPSSCTINSIKALKDDNVCNEQKMTWKYESEDSLIRCGRMQCAHRAGVPRYKHQLYRQLVTQRTLLHSQATTLQPAHQGLQPLLELCLCPFITTISYHRQINAIHSRNIMVSTSTTTTTSKNCRTFLQTKYNYLITS